MILLKLMETNFRSRLVEIQLGQRYKSFFMLKSMIALSSHLSLLGVQVKVDLMFKLHVVEAISLFLLSLFS